MVFKGTATALITPFTAEGVDYEALGALVDYQLAGGIDALLILGTTGEPPTMTAEEKKRVLAFAVERVGGRVPVIAGAGSNCTAQAAQNAADAQRAGADAVLTVTPYYNKCTQEGLFRHYEAVCAATELPVIAYNVPGRTGVNMLPETAARLTALPNLAGIKEACGNIEQIERTIEAVAGTRTVVYSGDDGLTNDIVRAGGMGLISVASNVIPAQMRAFVNAALTGDTDKAEADARKYAELFRLLFAEVSPSPVKYACSLLGLCRNVLRLPLLPMSAAPAQLLRAEMRRLNLIGEEL